MVKGVVWSVFISDLFPHQFREVDSGSGMGEEPLPPCALKPRASAVWRPVHSADQLTKPDVVPSEREAGQRGCLRCRPLWIPVPKFSFRLVAGTHLNFWIHFFSSILRKWLQKYWSGQIILFYFFILPHFPHLTKKEIPSPSPIPPASPFMQNWKWQYLIIAIMI